jgi:hypothetical protein
MQKSNKVHCPSTCGPKLLEQKDLAILGLGVVSINVGLGGLGTFLRVVILVGSDLQPLKIKSHYLDPRIVVLTGVPLSTGA